MCLIIAITKVRESVRFAGTCRGSDACTHAGVHEKCEICRHVCRRSVQFDHLTGNAGIQMHACMHSRVQGFNNKTSDVLIKIKDFLLLQYVRNRSCKWFDSQG